MKDEWGPTGESNRLIWVDMARGFAILGIFFVNIVAFSAPYFLYGGSEEVWDTPLNQATLAFIDIFFQGSFYTLFSILFGFSWQLIYERTASKEMKPSSFLFRRQLVLIVFGSIHAFFIWHGDILLSYGIIGLLLLLFIDIKNRNILVWAGVLLIGSATLLTTVLYHVRSLLGEQNTTMIEQSIMNYSSNKLSVILGQNFNDWLYANGGINLFITILMILPLFLIGMYIARKGWVHKPGNHQRFLNRILIISFIIFIGFKFGPYLFGSPPWFNFMQDQIGGTASALFYFFGIVSLGQTSLGKKLLRPLKYVGRMALSNYIIQSIFCFFLFYGIGLGFYHSVTPFQSLFLVIAFYVLQVFFSKWWLERFRFGPFEWLLRSLYYNKKQPIHK